MFHSNQLQAQEQTGQNKAPGFPLGVGIFSLDLYKSILSACVRPWSGPRVLPENKANKNQTVIVMAIVGYYLVVAKFK